MREPRATSFVDWFHVNSRWVAIGAAVVAIAAGVAWYIPHQRALASQNADRMLLDAKRSLNSGNAQLAESDLRKVADRYAGSPSGIEAGLLVGQLHLQKDEAPAAVTYLQGLVGKVGTGPDAAAAQQETPAMAAEAKVRLGELAAAGRS
jgi:outer membrane protein assembly factor BamD (BamD/ComL family)